MGTEQSKQALESLEDTLNKLDSKVSALETETKLEQEKRILILKATQKAIKISLGIFTSIGCTNKQN